MDSNQSAPIQQKTSIKRLFLISLITSLVGSALIAIIVFLFGDFDETEAKILLTTLTIGGYSLTALCSSIWYDKRKYLPLAFSGIIVSIAGFVITTFYIWTDLDIFDETMWKLIITLIILAVSLAHTSLILLAKSDNKPLVNNLVFATIAFIILVASMVLVLVYLNFEEPGELFYRLLGVFAVLDVLGTIVTPILKKVNTTI